MAKESGQKFIARNRAPRVQIEYDLETNGAMQKKQIPFVMGVLADLSGKSAEELPEIEQRKALEIDMDNFDSRLKAMKPRVTFAVPNKLTGEGQLAVDVYETEDKLVVKARTAGVNKEDLDVSISDGILTISGTLSSGDDTEVSNWHIQECYWGEFSRTVALPVAVKEDEASAALKDGVLTIAVPKKPEAQPKKIPIATGAARS